MATKFIRVTAISVQAIYGGDEIASDPMNFFLLHTRPVIGYRTKVEGPVFINPDSIDRVSTKEYEGCGRVTQIETMNDRVDVSESLEQVMMQLEGRHDY